MALLQGLFAAIFRSLGKILNTAFGWATILLFGKVPAKKQTYLSLASLGSLLWFIVVLGIASPSVATFLLAFVTLPEWFVEGWLRLVMLGAALVIPAIVGVLSILMLDAEDRPAGVGGKIKAVLRGYPYTMGLAITFVLMMILAPIMKLQTLARRWTDAHVPILVEPRDYVDVLSDIEHALHDGGMETRREKATWMLRLPTRILSFFSGSTVAKYVAKELIALRGEGLEVVLHPSDLIVRGKERTVARIRSILTERLTFTKAYFTYEKEAHELEDDLRHVYESSMEKGQLGVIDRKALAKLEDIERRMRKLELPYEEWEVLFREKLQVERTVMGTGLGLRGYHPESAIEKLAREAA